MDKYSNSSCIVPNSERITEPPVHFDKLVSLLHKCQKEKELRKKYVCKLIQVYGYPVGESKAGSKWSPSSIAFCSITGSLVNA